MKRGLSLLMLSAVFCGNPFVAVFANDASDASLDVALNQWQAGDLAEAREQLDSIIISGTEDSRVYYYRGILDENAGQDGTKDFSLAAKLEAATGTRTLVNRSLEKIQGPVRGKIEDIRESARNALKADPEAARLKSVYRKALEARTSGDIKSALAMFQEITDVGSDPRFFYMYGVTLLENGDRETAQAAFAEGLKHEKTLVDTQLVSIALSDVQGEARRLIEEQTLSTLDGEVITRQTNTREIHRRATMSQDQLLSEANLAATQVIQQQEEQKEARRLAAAAAIVAELKAQEELQAKLDERPKPIAAATEPPAGAKDMPANEPVVAAIEPVDPDAPVNPFLAGAKALPAPDKATVNSAAAVAGSIDMSWLPASTDYVAYIRPADLLNTGFISSIAELPQVQVNLNELTRQSGIAAADIESATMGVANAIGALAPVLVQVARGERPDTAAMSQKLMSSENSLLVIRTNKDIDIADTMSVANGTKEVDGDATYYLLPAAGSSQVKTVFYPIDSMTFLMGPESAIKAAIVAGPGEATNEMFAFVSSESHLVQAFASPLLAGMSGGLPNASPQSPPMLGQFLTSVKGNISGVAISADVDSDVKLTITLNLTEASVATDASGPLSQVVQMAKQMAPFALGQAPAPLQPSLKQAADTLAVSSSDTLLKLTANLPDSFAQALKDSANLLPAGESNEASPPDSSEQQ